MSQKVLMVVPYGWLNVSPSLQNECEVLAREGCRVDVYHPQDDEFDVWEPPSEAIEVHPVERRFDPNLDSPVLSKAVDLPQFQFALWRAVDPGDYDVVVAVDVYGLVHVAGLCLPRRSPPPVIYHSLESMVTSVELNRRLEELFSRTADLGITMADNWAEGIAARTRLDREDIYVVPNAPVRRDAELNRDLITELLDVPPGRNVALYAGSFIPDHMATEIVETVPDWPDDWVFVAHGWGPEEMIPVLEDRAGDLLGERVFVSSEVLPDEEYTSLVASADLGLSLYSPDDELKWRYGHPGKLYKYMQAGIPIVASRTPAQEPLVEGNDCGVCVSDPEEIPGAIEQVAGDYETYAGASSAAFDRYEFASNYERVLDRLRRDGILS